MPSRCSTSIYPVKTASKALTVLTLRSLNSVAAHAISMKFGIQYNYIIIYPNAKYKVYTPHSLVFASESNCIIQKYNLLYS